MPKQKTKVFAFPLLEDRLISLEEAAQLLCLDGQTLRRLSNAGQIADVKVGGRRHFRLTEIQRVIREGCGKAPLPVPKSQRAVDEADTAPVKRQRGGR